MKTGLTHTYTAISAAVAILASLPLLTSCGGEKETTPPSDASAANNSPLPTTLALGAAPEDAISIVALKQQHTPGDEVTFSARVMGRTEVFVPGRAIMIVGDPDILTPCNEKPDDLCETPWDVCCDPPEDRRLSTLTVQVVDETGSVLPTDLRGFQGITELSHLTITGTLATGGGDAPWTVNATGIHVEPADSSL